MNEQKISWKRSDLKWRGKQAFKKNYWSAVLVSLVLAIVMATSGSGAATGSAGNVASPDYGVTTYSWVRISMVLLLMSAIVFPLPTG